MNLLETALTQIQNLVRSQAIQIQNTASQVINGVSRPSPSVLIEAKAHIQPLNQQEIKPIADGVNSSQEAYRLWIFGDNLHLVKSALNQNEKSEILWNKKVFIVFSKTDWSLNGWIEALIVLQSEEADPAVTYREFAFRDSYFKDLQFEHQK